MGLLVNRQLEVVHTCILCQIHQSIFRKYSLQELSQRLASIGNRVLQMVELQYLTIVFFMTKELIAIKFW